MQLHKTQKCSKKVAKLLNNYEFINNLFDNLKLTNYSYELQAKSDKFQFPSMFILIRPHDHKQQLTFLQRSGDWFTNSSPFGYLNLVVLMNSQLF